MPAALNNSLHLHPIRADYALMKTNKQLEYVNIQKGTNHMRVIDKNGNVLMERELHPVTAKKSSLRVIRHTKSRNKTVTPVVMSKEEFFCFTNPDDKSVFSFRIPAKEKIILQ